MGSSLLTQPMLQLGVRIMYRLHTRLLTVPAAAVALLAVALVARVVAGWFDRELPSLVNPVIGLGAVVASILFTSRVANRQFERLAGIAGVAFGVFLLADRLSHNLVRVLMILSMPVAALGVVAAFVHIATRDGFSSSWMPSEPRRGRGAMFTPGRESSWTARVSVVVMLGGAVASVIFEVLLLKS
jgi:hypothetical protein